MVSNDFDRAFLHGSPSEVFDHVELKEAKACPLTQLMASRPTNVHRSVTPTGYHSGGGIGCIRQDMKRRSGNLGRRFSSRCSGAAEFPELDQKPT